MALALGSSPDKKDILFRYIKKWKWEKIIKELKYCVLLCKCCHGAYHSKELDEYGLNIIQKYIDNINIEKLNRA